MIKYTQIALYEREKIYQFLKTGKSITKIARLMGRNKSTISREVLRNSSNMGYLPDRADNKALRRKNRKLSKIAKYPEVRDYITSKLSYDKWSPEMIAGRMKLEKHSITISHETIYSYIYSYDGRKQELYKHLMYARPRRQLKYSRRHRYTIPENHKISNRPEHINTRSEFGHFEGDLTFFKGSRNGNLAVLVERSSRKSFVIRNNNKRSINIMLNLVKTTKKLPEEKIKSITFDNGGEFKQFGLLTMAGTNTYFCEPGSPWQKGQVERTNAMLHKFIPKSTNFNYITEDNVLNAQDKLNNLPRKCLNFLTPNEAWNNMNNYKVALDP
jgi:IS30 family transposase